MKLIIVCTCTVSHRPLFRNPHWFVGEAAFICIQVLVSGVDNMSFYSRQARISAVCPTVLLLR